MTERATLHVVVRGRVQGVGFRWFVREAAKELGVSGWVKNRADGTVEVLGSGPASALGELRARLEHGPRGASVSAVDELTDDESAPDDSFVILK